ncbi:hypothetical protein [Phenylobacterium sp.]|uniref:hypothetical protein n=1 Tax=Phenylobacterium sp. TaxID=1871053 RepID=UPI003BAB4231
MLIAMPLSASRPVKAALVNWLPWSVLKISGLPCRAMAVHHITEADFTDDTPVCTPDRLRRAVWGGEAPDALVAHSSDFERQFVTETVTDALPWICTYKVALRVWPEAPRHSNQVLRYWRGLNLDLDLAMPPHRGGLTPG